MRAEAPIFIPSQVITNTPDTSNKINNQNNRLTDPEKSTHTEESKRFRKKQVRIKKNHPAKGGAAAANHRKKKQNDGIGKVNDKEYSRRRNDTAPTSLPKICKAKRKKKNYRNGHIKGDDCGDSRKLKFQGDHCEDGKILASFANDENNIAIIQTNQNNGSIKTEKNTISAGDRVKMRKPVRQKHNSKRKSKSSNFNMLRKHAPKESVTEKIFGQVKKEKESDSNTISCCETVQNTNTFPLDSSVDLQDASSFPSLSLSSLSANIDNHNHTSKEKAEETIRNKGMVWSTIAYRGHQTSNKIKQEDEKLKRQGSLLSSSFMVLESLGDQESRKLAIKVESSADKSMTKIGSLWMKNKDKNIDRDKDKGINYFSDSGKCFDDEHHECQETSHRYNRGDDEVCEERDEIVQHANYVQTLSRKINKVNHSRVFNLKNRLRERWMHALEEKRRRDTEEENKKLTTASKLDQSTLLQRENDSLGNGDIISISSSFSSSDGSISSSSEGSTESDSMNSDCSKSSTNEIREYIKSSHPLHLAILNNNEIFLKELLKLPPHLTNRDSKVTLKKLQSQKLLVDRYDLVCRSAPAKPVVELRLNDTGILQSHKTNENAKAPFSALHLAVQLDRPNLIKLLLDSSSFSAVSMEDTDEMHRTALMLASELSLDGCVKLLLSYGPRISSRHKLTGNSALHMACKNGEPSTVRLILNSVGGIGRSGGGRGNQNSQQRLVCCRNNLGETPLHVACSFGRTHIVEAVLSSVTSSCAARVLKVKDEKGDTPLLSAIRSGAMDVVMHLLMWRGNQRDLPFAANKGQSYKHLNKDVADAYCPLTVAVATGSVEMVRLLLEFSDPSASAGQYKYDYNTALCQVSLSFEESFSALSSEGVEIIRMLIEAGANPHLKCESSLIGEDGRYMRKDDLDEYNTALCKAAFMGQTRFVISMLNTSSYVQKYIREARRKDPLLRNQPDSYFRTIDAKEGVITDVSTQDALVLSLFLAWKNEILNDNGKSTGSCFPSRHYFVALAIYKHGVILNQYGWNQLLSKIWAGKAKLDFDRFDGGFVFEASYKQICLVKSPELKKITPYDRSLAQGWSVALSRLEWIFPNKKNEKFYCEWMKNQMKLGYRYSGAVGITQQLEDDECNLVIDGQQVPAHKSILSVKSRKLEAAIRFAEMKRGASHISVDKRKIDIVLDLPLEIAKMLVAHCYHGSILSGLSLNPRQCCEQLLELSIVAEEFLCPSLSSECEMRLLSNNPYKCFCFNCCYAVEPSSLKVDGENEQTSSITCVNRVNGASLLLTSNTALDVLAAAQDTNLLRKSYHISEVNRSSKAFEPFSALKSVTIKIMLMSFSEILKSESFISHLRSMAENAQDIDLDDSKLSSQFGSFLLQTCVGFITQAPLYRPPLLSNIIRKTL